MTGKLRKDITVFGMVVVTVLAVTGCGGDTYRQRLERTGRYFAYLEELDRDLTSPWSGAGVELRVPKPFQQIPEEAIRPKQDGNDQTPGLPARLRILEGLQAAWTAEVATGDGNRPAYILLATNRHLWVRGTATLEETQQFEDRFAVAVNLLAGQSAPRKSDWTEVTVSRDDGFVEPRVFRRYATASFPLGEHGERSHIVVYHFTKNVLQVAIVLVLPDGLSAAEKLTESDRIGLMLQSLRVIDVKQVPR